MADMVGIVDSAVDSVAPGPHCLMAPSAMLCRRHGCRVCVWLCSCAALHVAGPPHHFHVSTIPRHPPCLPALSLLLSVPSDSTSMPMLPTMLYVVCPLAYPTVIEVSAGVLSSLPDTLHCSPSFHTILRLAIWFVSCGDFWDWQDPIIGGMYSCFLWLMSVCGISQNPIGYRCIVVFRAYS